MLCSYSFASVCIIQDWPTWKTDRADIWQEQTSSSWSSGAPGLQLLPGVLWSSWWGAQVVVKTSAATTDRWQHPSLWMRKHLKIENHLSGSLIWWNNKQRVMWGWAPCSSLMRGGKKLSSKIGFVHKGGALRSLASLSSDAKPPLILCNYEISGGEEAKANWSKLAGRHHYHAIWNLLCKAVEKPLLSKIFSSVRCIRIPSQWPIYWRANSPKVGLLCNPVSLLSRCLSVSPISGPLPQTLHGIYRSARVFCALQ